MNAIVEFVKALGAARLAAMGAVAAGLIGFFIYLTVQLSQPQMAVLFSDVDFDDSIAIVKKLDGMNVPYEIRQEGAVIMAPKDRILRLRMDLAENGLPSGGAVGYEIFDKTGALGTTSFVQNINYTRALEGELARTIRALDRVVHARVHLVLPKKKLFSRETPSPSASIILKVRGSLGTGEIRAIQHLVASAVPELKPGRVSIVDDKGNLLASGSEDGNALAAARSDERTLGFERRLQAKIDEIVNSVVGEGHARVRVTAELDHNTITKTSDTFDPDGRVVRSSQTREESRDSSRKGSNQGVSVGNELPNANAGKAGSEGEKDASRKSEEIVNYEISHTTTTETRKAGRIKRLSVAVLVDGTYTPGANGKPAYAERPQAEIDKIEALVKSAMGYDKTRGDQLHVVNLRFAENAVPADAETPQAGFFELGKADYFHIAELAVLFIISTLVLLFVVRPLVKRIITPEVTEAELDEALLAHDGASGPLLTGPDGQPLPAGSKLPAIGVQENTTTDVIKNAKISGDLQASAVQEIGSIVESSPTDAVAVIRQWMNEDEEAAA